MNPQHTEDIGIKDTRMKKSVTILRETLQHDRSMGFRFTSLKSPGAPRTEVSINIINTR